MRVHYSWVLLALQAVQCVCPNCELRKGRPCTLPAPGPLASASILEHFSCAGLSPRSHSLPLALAGSS